VVDRLLDEDSQGMADLEAFIGKAIKLQVESQYVQDQYDIVLQ
jgi:ribonuclease G